MMKIVTKQANRKKLFFCLALATLLGLALFATAFAIGDNSLQANAETSAQQNLVLLSKAQIPDGVTLDASGKFKFTAERKVLLPTVLDTLSDDKIYLADGTCVATNEATIVSEATLSAVCVEGWKIPYMEFYRYNNGEEDKLANCQIRNTVGMIGAESNTEFWQMTAYNNDTYVLRLELTANIVLAHINGQPVQVGDITLPEGGTPVFQICAMPDITATFEDLKFYVKDKQVASYLCELDTSAIVTEVDEGDDLSGTLSATTVNGQTQEIALTDSSVQISGFDKNVPGDQEVTFSVTTHNQTITAKKTVKVNTAKVIDHYSVALKNAVLECGHTFDKSNVAITVHYEEGDTGNKAFEEDEITVSGFDPYKLGEQTVTVAYGGADYTITLTVQDTVSNRLDIAQSQNAITGLKTENDNLTFTNNNGNITLTNHTAFTTDTKIGIANSIEGKDYFKKYTDNGELEDEKGKYDWVQLSDLTVVFAYDVIATDHEAEANGDPSYTPHVFFGNAAYRIQIADSGPFVWESDGTVAYRDGLSYANGMGISAELSSTQVIIYNKNDGWQQVYSGNNTYENYTQIALEFYNRFAWTYEFTDMKLCFTDPDVDVTSGLTEAQYNSQVLGYASITVENNKALYYLGDALDIAVYGFTASATDGVLLDSDLYTVDGDTSEVGERTVTIALTDKPEVTAQVAITVAKFKNLAVTNAAVLPTGVTLDENGKFTFNAECKVLVPTVLKNLTDSMLYLADGTSSVTLDQVTYVYEATMSAVCVEGWKVPYIEFWSYTNEANEVKNVSCHLRTSSGYLFDLPTEDKSFANEGVLGGADTYVLRLELTGNKVSVFINDKCALQDYTLPEGGTPIFQLCAMPDITATFENVKFYIKNTDLFNYVADISVTPTQELHVGDDFSATVTATYIDGTTVTVASNGYLVSGYNKQNAGKQNVTVKVITENVECAKTVAVTVIGDTDEPDEPGTGDDNTGDDNTGDGDNNGTKNPTDDETDKNTGCGCGSAIGTTSVFGGLLCLAIALVIGKRRKQQNN